MLNKTFTLFLLTLCFTGCAGLMTDRAFINEMDHETDGFFVAGRDFNVTSGDSGAAFRSRDEIAMRTPYYEGEDEDRLERRSLEKELRRKEMRLTSIGKTQYREAAPYLESTSEKIYFLNLSSYEKDEYLRMRRLRPIRRNTGRSVASLSPLSNGMMTPRGIEIGMSKSNVVGLWGRPEKVEVAGNPRNENERWAFYDGVSVRYVYFENGTVQGWKAN